MELPYSWNDGQILRDVKVFTLIHPLVELDAPLAGYIIVYQGFLHPPGLMLERIADRIVNIHLPIMICKFSKLIFLARNNSNLSPF
jgi:hypothetical protein